MTRTTTTLAVAADYADALMTARRAKNWLFLLLTFFVAAQLALFLLVRFNVLKLEDRAGITPAGAPAVVVPATTPATEPADVTSAGTGTPTPVTPRPAHTVSVDDILKYAIPVINFLGVALAVVLAVVLLLLTAIMLVGRLIGVSHVTSAFIWSVVLLVLLFPWQAFLISSEDYAIGSPTTHDLAYGPQPAFKFPGVLYTYPELRQDYHFSTQPLPASIVKWGRYVALPVAALFILLMVQGKSGRGLRFALGESDVQVEVSTRPGDPLV